MAKGWFACYLVRPVNRSYQSVYQDQQSPLFWIFPLKHICKTVSDCCLYIGDKNYNSINKYKFPLKIFLTIVLILRLQQKICLISSNFLVHSHWNCVRGAKMFLLERHSKKEHSPVVFIVHCACWKDFKDTLYIMMLFYTSTLN